MLNSHRLSRLISILEDLKFINSETPYRDSNKYLNEALANAIENVKSAIAFQASNLG